MVSSALQRPDVVKTTRAPRRVAAMSPPPSVARMTAARSGCVLDHRQTLRRNASRGGHAKAARTLSASTRRIRQGVPASASSSSAAGVAAALGGGVAAKSSLSHCHNRTAKRRVAPAKRSTSTLHRRRTTMLVPSPSSRPTRHDQRTNCQAPSAKLVVTAPRAWLMAARASRLRFADGAWPADRLGGHSSGQLLGVVGELHIKH